MKVILTIILAVAPLLQAAARVFSYRFDNTPVAEALVMIGRDHPELNLSFIYKELDHYRTSASIDTDDVMEALRMLVGQNPVSVVRNESGFYLEALQHGKYIYSGRAAGGDSMPVAGATVMLLNPRDSTVITYGVTDGAGRFAVPCDRCGVIIKLTSIGYRPALRYCSDFAVGEIRMEVLPLKLKEVRVEADDASLYADRSVYRPTQRQKNASQTATDLLSRMAIPQLDVTLGSEKVSTTSGQAVAMYIDYVPATADDLRVMRIADVKSVEYLEYPNDPRFQGNRHVINFRMVKYEYGGYVKDLTVGNFIANSGQTQANGRLVRGKMTYDVMGYGYCMSNDHISTDITEQFRLPQHDGTVKDFTRETSTASSKSRRQNYEGSLRALYAAEKVTANSRITAGTDRKPHIYSRGSVRYSPEAYPNSDYLSASASRASYLKYSGYYYFALPKNNSLTASLDYEYAHTNENSEYTEPPFTPLLNGASDYTNGITGQLSYAQTIGQAHSLTALARTIYEHNSTQYSGSVNTRDRSITQFNMAGASYSYNRGGFYGYAGAGWTYLVTKLNANTSRVWFPYADASAGYSFSRKLSVDAYFHYSVWPPSSNYKSENLIHVSPFMWHTGNPSLESHRSYDFGASVMYVPSNRFRISAFGHTWMVGNRAAFVYTASADGVVRNIVQPIGSLRQHTLGLNASTRQLDGKLQLSGKLSYIFSHNGEPYDENHNTLSYYMQALYYTGSFNFAVSYQSQTGSNNYDSMSGRWTVTKGNFMIQGGWSNAAWNIRLAISNPQRWNWRSARETMHSDCYSYVRTVSSASSHAYIQASATFTFGFGKKVDSKDNISKQSGASSGILK